MPETPRAPIAQHEAGHAVVAMALGIEVVIVSRDQQLTKCGSLFTAAIQRVPVAPRDVRRAALFCLAGVAYENLLAGLYDCEDDALIPPSRPDIPICTEEAVDDLYEAYRFADMLEGGPASRRTVVALLARVLAILERNLDSAQAITQELWARGTLTGDEALQIWRSHGGQLEPEATAPL